jgi:2-C-methyl-D-erythritol 4-phosphate cytidylyltransferase
MNATAIIVAAGEGRRLGGTAPKIFLPLGGRAVILHTLDRFFSAAAINQVIVVVGASHMAAAEAMLREDPAAKHRPWLLQSGGATRQESVRRGLEKIGANAEIVAIHDGARPFASPALIDRCVQAAQEKGAVVTGLRARDTIKVVAEDGWIATTPARDALWEIQTPQVFLRPIIVDAHAWAAREGFEATDDAALVERKGGKVFLLEGERTNIKITFPEDVWFAEAIIREGRMY